MDEFLADCKANVNEHCTKCLVVGNYHGHFGSIMSSISFAFYMQNRRLHNEEDSIDYYIPIVYAHRDLIDTKTDFLFYMEKFGVKSDDLLCLDDIYFENFDMIIMVDFQAPHIYDAFDENLVKMVFATHDEAPDFIPPDDCELVYKAADSIATVVADYILQSDPQNLTDDDKLSLKILYDCILYQLDNARNEELYPEDTRMLFDLEGFLGIPDEAYGESLLNDLALAYEDFTGLNAMQILYKYSMGNVAGVDDKVIYFSCIPMGIKELCEMPAFRTGVLELSEWLGCSVMVIMGRTVDDDNNTESSLGVISFQDSCLYKKILDKLVYESDFKLSYRGWILGFNGKWYKMQNQNSTIDEVKDLIEPLIPVD